VSSACLTWHHRRIKGRYFSTVCCWLPSPRRGGRSGSVRSPALLRRRRCRARGRASLRDEPPRAETCVLHRAETLKSCSSRPHYTSSPVISDTGRKRVLVLTARGYAPTRGAAAERGGILCRGPALVPLRFVSPHQTVSLPEKRLRAERCRAEPPAPAPQEEAPSASRKSVWASDS